MGADGLPADYSFLAATQVKDSAPAGTIAPAGSTDTPPAATGGQAATTTTTAPTGTGACTPRSRITRIRRHRRTLRLRGITATTCGAAVSRVTVTVRRGAKTRRYRIMVRSRTATLVERRKRGHRVRVR